MRVDFKTFAPTFSLVGAIHLYPETPEEEERIATFKRAIFGESADKSRRLDVVYPRKTPEEIREIVKRRRQRQKESVQRWYREQMDEIEKQSEPMRGGDSHRRLDE